MPPDKKKTQKKIIARNEKELLQADIQKAEQQRFILAKKLADKKYQLMQHPNPDDKSVDALTQQLIHARENFDKYLEAKYLSEFTKQGNIENEFRHPYLEGDSNTINMLSVELSETGTMLEEIQKAQRDSRSLVWPEMNAVSLPIDRTDKKNNNESIPAINPELEITDVLRDNEYYVVGHIIAKDKAADFLKEKGVLLLEKLSPKMSEIAADVISAAIAGGAVELIQGSSKEDVLKSILFGAIGEIPVIGKPFSIGVMAYEILTQLQELEHKKRLIEKYGTTNVRADGTIVSYTQPKSTLEGTEWIRDTETVGDPLIVQNLKVDPPPGYSWDNFATRLVPEWKIADLVDYSKLLAEKPNGYYYNPPKAPQEHISTALFDPQQFNSKPHITPFVPLQKKETFTDSLLNPKEADALIKNYTPIGGNIVLPKTAVKHNNQQPKTHYHHHKPHPKPATIPIVPGSITLGGHITRQPAPIYHITIRELINNKISHQHITGTEQEAQLSSEHLAAQLHKAVTTNQLHTQ